MEKYSQFRDRASGIAPFLPIPSQPSGLYLPLHAFLFAIRLPILISFALTYFLVLQWLPIGSLGKKASLWILLGIPGVWWIDLQIDGVKKGSLARQRASRLPQPKSIIASSSTSPIDALYLAAIFDPIFTASYPSTRSLEHISLFTAILRAFSTPRMTPPPNTTLYTVAELLQKHPNRPITIFPECTTTNGRGILPFSPALADVPTKTQIFPVSLRYTPADITTPIPGTYARFIWTLLSRPTHCIRVRIAESIFNIPSSSSSPSTNGTTQDEDEAQNSDSDLESLLAQTSPSSQKTQTKQDKITLSPAEQATLTKTAEALARLGRVKRVGLGVKEKAEFVVAWRRGLAIPPRDGDGKKSR